MPAADEKLKEKVEALFEEKMPAIEVRLATIEIKQDQMLSKMDALSSTVNEHVMLQTRQELRIAAIEAKAQVADVTAEKKKDRRRTVLVGAMGAAVSAAVAFFLKWVFGA